MPTPTEDMFVRLVQEHRRSPRGGGEGAGARTPVVPLSIRLLDDQLTPVLAYRRLVAPDERTAPSFLLESVEGGERQGRHSILGAQPAIEVIARSRPDGAHGVRILDHRGTRRARGTPAETVLTEPDPLVVPRRLTAHLDLVPLPEEAGALPDCLIGGWVGYAAYDSVRYAEPEKLPFTSAPPDDRDLPELQFAYYDGVVVFDHVEKRVIVTRLVEAPPDADEPRLRAIWRDAAEALELRAQSLQTHSKPLASGRVDHAPVGAHTGASLPSNTTREAHASMVDRALEYIRAGDIFQVVIGQRFERRTQADPFDVYRALRAVNPSPYMVYLQGEGCILVASSPEILCRVRTRRADGGAPPKRIVTNRPLAGTRRRGATQAEDAALEAELLADPKERAEHVMLVDLGRNDVGRVAKPATVALPALMTIERYSHVMHISSTVTGELRDDLDAWDALRSTLPVGTISGAPKIRAMQIIDELEPVRRGPYGGGMGYVSLDGDMDIALALRTIVVPTDARWHGADGRWTYHIQAAGGIVLDSRPDAEFQETVNKAAALARAVDLAESAFRPVGEWSGA